MKVCTCLNPLHTALAILGCLLGYDAIYKEMEDDDLVEFIKNLGYGEGLPSPVDDPKIVKPKDFLDECVEKRFKNPNIPDTPQRIAMDTSQKIPIRFGETIKKYGKNAAKLEFIPFVISSWFRYLTGINDNGEKMELSPDPMLNELTGIFKGYKIGSKTVNKNAIYKLLKNEKIFGNSLVYDELRDKIIETFVELLSSKGAVRNSLKKINSAGR
jgi:fructuronate reductase